MKTKMLSIALALMLVFSAFMVIAPTYAGTKEEAIDAGMAWLAGKQNADGSWGTSPYWLVGETGFAVLKFETYAIEHNVDPFDLSYPYHTKVRSGLDYIFANAHTMAIGMQTHGDPDTDKDGIGVYFVSPLPYGYERTYETGIAMMAIAHSTHPGAVVNVIGSPVNSWKYKDVLQDAVDYLAFGQVDSGVQRGGWSYSEADNVDGWADNSNTGYAVLGLGYAQASPPGGFELTIPEFVKNELDVWVEYIQDPVSGGSGYGDPTSWINILKTGNLLYEMYLVGDSVTTPRVKRAISYIVAHWYDADYSPGWRGPGPGGDPTWPACYQNMYCAMKGLEAFGIEEIDGINWQADFETAILAQQNLDGSWPNAPMFGAPDGTPWTWDTDQVISTEWALLVLEKAVPPPPPPTLKEVKDEIRAIEAKLDKWLPEIKEEIMKIELKLDAWLPVIYNETMNIEGKLDMWLPDIKYEIKNEIAKQEVKVDIIPLYKENMGKAGDDDESGFFVHITLAGKRVDYQTIKIYENATLLVSPQYTLTKVMDGTYKLTIDKNAVKPPGIRSLVIDVTVSTYYGSGMSLVKH